MFDRQLYFLIIVFLIFVFSYICILNFFIVIHRGAAPGYCTVS